MYYRLFFKYLLVKDTARGFGVELKVVGFSEIEDFSNLSISLLEKTWDVAFDTAIKATKGTKEAWSLQRHLWP